MPALKYIPSYTVADYGKWEGEWELWDGIPVSMSPSPFGPHQWAATRLAASISQQLDALGGDDCFVMMEVDWIVNDQTVVRPNVSVCCGTFPEKFIETAPRLIIEVLSESTAQKDRDAKRTLYESQGVSHYLMLDTAKEQLEAFRLQQSAYVLVPQQEEISLKLHDGCEIQLQVPRRKT